MARTRTHHTHTHTRYTLPHTHPTHAHLQLHKHKTYTLTHTTTNTHTHMFAHKPVYPQPHTHTVKTACCGSVANTGPSSSPPPSTHSGTRPVCEYFLRQSETSSQSDRGQHWHWLLEMGGRNSETCLGDARLE